jgi:DNA mismatch repair protein MutS
MVEMQELSNILHSATEDSLVLLDEVGRGTATYDGISIAWAATEYIANEIKSLTLFATHYHELTALGDELTAVENVHVAADESEGEVTFLRTVREGATDRSYGIHVADLAGVPEPVVDRSRDVLDRLRRDEAIEVRGSGSGDDTTQVVFDLGSGEFAAGTADERVATDGSAARDTDPGSGSGTGAGTGTGGGSDDGESAPALDPETASILDELRELEVSETPPIELMAKVQEWQRELDED